MIEFNAKKMTKKVIGKCLKKSYRLDPLVF